MPFSFKFLGTPFLICFALVGCETLEREEFISSHEGEIMHVLVCQPKQRLCSGDGQTIEGADPRNYCDKQDVDLELFISELRGYFPSLTLVDEIFGHDSAWNGRVKPDLVRKACRHYYSECECLNAVQQMLTRWPQDVFFAQNRDSDVVLRTSHKENQKDASLSDLLSFRVADLCGVSWNTTSLLDFQGGNMAVNSSFLFLGRDVLASYVNPRLDGYESRLTAIGLELAASESEVTDRIGDICQRKVIWVGTENKQGWLWHTTDNYQSNQPIYHIDLFFSLLKWGGTHAKHRGDTLYYLLGMPSQSSTIVHFFGQNTDSTKLSIAYARTDMLMNWIRKSADNIDHQLKSQGVVGQRIEIPMPIQFRADRDFPAVERIWAYCNGLVEERNGETVYFMPSYSCHSDNPIIQTSFNDAVERIGENATVKPIMGVYEVNAALHCSVLVTERR